ncbi:tyrosine-type recombinase/integrase [bacterium]|nr:tyrosine-type recombinase/integrase [bacterium]
MRKKLTAKTVESLKPATRKRYEVWDTLTTGLHVRVSASGGKVWYLGARVDGRMRRIKLGAYPILSLAAARELARNLLRDVELGRFSREETAQAPTLGAVIPQFIDLYAKPRNRDWRNPERLLAKFEPLHDRPIDKIKRADVVRILDDIVASGVTTRANRALAAIKKLMNWAVDRGMLEANPIAGLKAPAKEIARDRVLSDRELVACWRGAEDDGYPFDAFVKFLILTAQRRGEVAGMRWSELDLERAIWTLPAKRVKNATTHTVPLAPLAVDILAALPRFLVSDLVFTTTGKSPISGFGRLKQRLDVAVGDHAEDWRFHDIRRTVATNMAIIGVQPHIIEAVLNHKNGVVSGVAAVYNRHVYFDEKRAALEEWAKRLQALTAETTRHGGQDRTGLLHFST